MWRPVMKNALSILIGILIGIAFLLAMGGYYAGETDFGFAVPGDGYAVVTDEDGYVYVIEAQTATAIPVVSPQRGRSTHHLQTRRP